jgi:CIC family chloride channel protein
MQWLRDALGRLPKQTRTVLFTLVVGFAAGGLTVLFQLAINEVFHATIGRFAKMDTASFLIWSFVFLVGGALASGWLLSSFCKEAAGSGIPQLKTAFWKDFGFVKPRVIWVKFVAGILQVGTGSSLGREGPSVQFSGALGSALSGLSGEPKQRRRLGAAAGAAAGLAAAFNTPLAAVTFVLEEIIGDLNSRLLGGVLLAAVVGALMTHGFIGSQPAFELSTVSEPGLTAYLLVPIVAAVATLVGVLFQKSALRLRSESRGWSKIPPAFRPAIGGIVCWGLGVLVFLQCGKLGVFGLGYGDLTDALAGKLTWQIALVLVLAKLAATVFSYGTGGCGGIFAPTLFFGAMTGVALAGVFGLFLPNTSIDLGLMAIVGMSATLGAVVGAPVTSILIVFEMTHQFALVPPLMITALISQAISRRLRRANFYDELLEQDGHDVERFTPPRDLRSWHAQPVSHLSTRNVVCVSDLDPAVLKQTLGKHPFDRFPYVKDGKLAGVLRREDMEEAIKNGAAPAIFKATNCRPNITLRGAESLLVEDETGALILQEVPDGPPTGILTLHDVLRAEQSAADRGE